MDGKIRGLPTELRRDIASRHSREYLPLLRKPNSALQIGGVQFFGPPEALQSQYFLRRVSHLGFPEILAIYIKLSGLSHSRPMLWMNQTNITVSTAMIYGFTSTESVLPLCLARQRPPRSWSRSPRTANNWFARLRPMYKLGCLRSSAIPDDQESSLPALFQLAEQTYRSKSRSCRSSRYIFLQDSAR